MSEREEGKTLDEGEEGKHVTILLPLLISSSTRTERSPLSCGRPRRLRLCPASNLLNLLFDHNLLRHDLDPPHLISSQIRSTAKRDPPRHPPILSLMDAEDLALQLRLPV